MVTGKYDSGETSANLGPNSSIGNNYLALEHPFPHQKESVKRYIEVFEAYYAKIPNQSEERLLIMFLRGLRSDICIWVRTILPLTYEHVKAYACKIE